MDIIIVYPFKDLRYSFKSNNNVIEIYLHTIEDRGKNHFCVKNYNPIDNFIEINTTILTPEQTFEYFKTFI